MVTAAGGKPDGREGDDGGADSAAAFLGAQRHALVVQAVVKALAEVVHGECESREEEVLKARLPEAQAYVAELEGYMSAIVSEEALKVIAASSNGGGQDNGCGLEIDDDLWRLFAVRETRLYSSSAALGKRPGRIYVTSNTLWFHSKVRAQKVFLLFVSFAVVFCLPRRPLVIRAIARLQACSLLRVVAAVLSVHRSEVSLV